MHPESPLFVCLGSVKKTSKLLIIEKFLFVRLKGFEKKTRIFPNRKVSPTSLLSDLIIFTVTSCYRHHILVQRANLAFIIIQDSLSTQWTQWKDSGVEKFLSAVSPSQISSPPDLNPKVFVILRMNLQDFFFRSSCFFSVKIFAFNVYQNWIVLHEYFSPSHRLTDFFILLSNFGCFVAAFFRFLWILFLHSVLMIIAF